MKLSQGSVVFSMLALGVSLYALEQSGNYGSMPVGAAAWSQVAVAKAGQQNPLGGLVGIVTHTALPDGGSQGFEVYNYIAHPAGDQRLALSIISNVEIAGDGDVVEVRGVGSGLIHTGLGRVETFIAFYANCPPESETQCTLLEGEGWKFVVSDGQLEIIRPDGSLAAVY